MIRLTKITHLVGNKPNAELHQEVLEFFTFHELREDNSMVSRVTLQTYSPSAIEHEVVREFVISPKRLNAIFVLNTKG